MTFFFFWELLSLTTAGVIFLNKEDNVYNTGLLYLLTHLSGGILLLLGIMINYQYTGSLELATPQAGVPFFILAIGIKTAFIPFHYWLVYGYPAATWAGTVLLSALSTKIGVYAVARILEPSLSIAYMGGFMAVFGIIMALLQKKMRPLLCYHIISQVGYMVAGVGLGVTLSIDGGLLHLLNHMLYKALLLMSAGTVIYVVGTEKMKNLGGLWRKLPVTAAGGLIGSLAITGAPPFNGFISKTMLKYGTEQERVLSILLLIASIGTAMSFSKFMYFTFLKKKDKNQQMKIKTEAPWGLRTAMIITSLLVIIMGIFPSILGHLAPYQSSTFVYSFSAIKDSLLFIIAGIIGFIGLSSFLDPARVLLPHEIINLIRSKLKYSVRTVIVNFKKVSHKEQLMNFGNSFWLFLFTITCLISYFIIIILY